MHAAHDLLRVAEAVDRGVRPAPVIEFCARCADLYRELVALTAALPLAAPPARPRDFTLSALDARRLRVRGWPAWWSQVGSSRDAVTKPLAVGLTALGLAGLLATGAPSLISMAGATGAAASIELGAAAASPDPGALGSKALGSQPTPQPRDVATEPAADGPSTLVVSGGLLGVGGGLFAMRRIAPLRRRVR
jgi:hypothetical protein